MDEQLDVDDAFEEPRARLDDLDTAHDAAQLAGRHASRLRARCHEALLAAGAAGLTDFQLADRVGIQQTSAGKRRLELERAGLVEGTGERRRTPSGATAMVWRARR